MKCIHSLNREREAHPLEKYVGRLAIANGEELEVVGYRDDVDSAWALIVDGTKIGGWVREMPDPNDVVFKKCECYFYVDTPVLMI